MPVVSVRGLGKAYSTRRTASGGLLDALPWRSRVPVDAKWVLQDVSFDVKRGETIGVIGRNGSGKSTLLQLIAGVLRPSAGTVAVDGRLAALLELGAGFNPEFSGRDNIRLGAAILGLDPVQIAQRMDHIVAFADIGDYIDQPVKRYSSGMFVRLAFAVAAHVDAEILIIDEALSVGDAFFVQKCMRFLRDFMRRGTVLFCSHDIGAVTNLCDRALLLSEGRIEAIGAPKDVAARYLETLFENSITAEDECVAEGDTGVGARDGVVRRDMRSDLFNGSNLRNDVEVFSFDAAQAAFGSGAARITDVRLLDNEGVPLAWLVGGEEVTLQIEALATEAIARPILGFTVKDRLGQEVFVDNTYLPYRDRPVQLLAGQAIVATFKFDFPYLPTGEYAVSPAIANGTQESHEQLHWIHDALVLRVHASPVRLGLVGIPMHGISLERK
ncbi:MAG: ABC transporter ATP-binding protein [Burkholderiales bacterium]